MSPQYVPANVPVKVTAAGHPRLGQAGRTVTTSGDMHAPPDQQATAVNVQFDVDAAIVSTNVADIIRLDLPQ